MARGAHVNAQPQRKYGGINNFTTAEAIFLLRATLNGVFILVMAARNKLSRFYRGIIIWRLSSGSARRACDLLLFAHENISHFGVPCAKNKNNL